MVKIGEDADLVAVSPMAGKTRRTNLNHLI